MTREEAIEMLKYIKYTGNGESEYKNCAQGVAIDMAIQSLEAWDDVIKHLETTASELLERDYETQSYALFAKGIIFSVRMIKNHMKEVEKSKGWDGDYYLEDC